VVGVVCEIPSLMMVKKGRILVLHVHVKVHEPSYISTDKLLLTKEDTRTLFAALVPEPFYRVRPSHFSLVRV
jgi:hypothetical protein